MRQRMEAVVSFAKRTGGGGVADSPCIHVGSNDASFRWLLLLCGIVRGSLQDTAPRNTAKNIVKHRDDGES